MLPLFSKLGKNVCQYINNLYIYSLEDNICNNQNGLKSKLIILYTCITKTDNGQNITNVLNI